MSEVLSTRRLNRAMLARQMLLERHAFPVDAAVEALAGMQTQVPQAPYVGLWSRLREFAAEDLSERILAREVVRMPLMRATLHLVTARDCPTLRPLLRPMLERVFQRATPYGKQLGDVDLEAVLAQAKEMLEERPRTRAELGRMLGERFPGRDRSALAQAVTYLLPVVQVPPRGLWGESGQPAWASVESWLAGQGNPDAVDVVVLLRRYLLAFGPATVADMQAWSGLSGLREVVEGMRSELVTFRDERGRELLDVPDGPLPAAETKAPPRFLPEFDNLLVAYAERSRVVHDEHRQRVFGNLGARMLLIDGFAGATWEAARTSDGAVLTVRPFAALEQEDEAAISEEGLKLLAFLSPGAPGEVRFEET